MKEYLSRIFTGTKERFMEQIVARMLGGHKEFIITANPEILMKSEQDAQIREILLSKDVTIVPDGISVVKAMRHAGIPAKERITGIDLLQDLLQAAGQHGMTVYMLGAKEAIVSDLVRLEAAKHPTASYHYHNGYDGDKNKIFEEIKALQPDLIIVALGVPAQELLIAHHFKDFTKGIFIGVGGSFDVLSGHKRRAPQFFIRTNTEWLYRILREPSRIKRFYESNIKFMRHVKKDLN